MTKALLAALALAAATAAPAAAGNDSTYAGGCSYSAVTDSSWQVGQPDHYTGELDAAAVVYSPSDPAQPVTATLTCLLYVRGDLAYAESFTGTGVIAGAVPIEFDAADPDDEVTLCESMDFADDTPTYDICYAIVPHEIPPAAVLDALHEVVGLVPGATEALCAVLASGAVPDLGRLVSTDDDGDLWLDERRWFDCPPRG